MHFSFLIFNFFFHQLSLLNELRTLHFDVVCFGHFIFNLLHQLFLLIFLYFEDSFNILFFILPFHQLLVLFLFVSLFSLSLDSNQVLFLAVYFSKHLNLGFLHSSFIQLSHFSSFQLFLFLLSLLFKHLLLMQLLKFSFTLLSFVLPFKILLFSAFLHGNILLQNFLHLLTLKFRFLT